MFIITLVLNDGTHQVLVPFTLFVFELPEVPVPEQTAEPLEPVKEPDPVEKNETIVDPPPATEE